MHGPWLNTLQNDGVHGSPDSTLHGACENGTELIWWRLQAWADPAITVTAPTMAMSRTTRRSM
jgi:hypothetical protein